MTEIAYGLKFTADGDLSWRTRDRLETIKAVVDVSKKMSQLVLLKGNYFISPSEIYKKVFKDDLVTFHWLGNGGDYCERRWPQAGIEAGVQCYNGNTTTYIQMAHELGHVFNAAIENKITRGEISSLTKSPYKLLGENGIYYYDRKGKCVWIAYYKDRNYRTFEGMVRSLIQNPTTNASNAKNEDFADMFAHWTYNQFTSDNAGFARTDWMDTHMTTWLFRVLNIPVYE
ncbi:MAG: hypothetical protein GYA36_19925 [Veillonellaceae bacterium]|nr:hypothetical protein [Veillonellaceae bacterium]